MRDTQEDRKGPRNQPAPANAGVASRSAIGHHRPGVTEPGGCGSTKMKFRRNLATSLAVFLFCCGATAVALRHYSRTRHLEPIATLHFEPICDTFGVSTNETVASTTGNKH